MYFSYSMNIFFLKCTVELNLIDSFFTNSSLAHYLVVVAFAGYLHVFKLSRRLYLVCGNDLFQNVNFVLLWFWNLGLFHKTSTSLDIDHVAVGFVDKASFVILKYIRLLLQRVFDLMIWKQWIADIYFSDSHWYYRLN